MIEIGLRLADPAADRPAGLFPVRFKAPTRRGSGAVLEKAEALRVGRTRRAWAGEDIRDGPSIWPSFPWNAREAPLADEGQPPGRDPRGLSYSASIE